MEQVPKYRNMFVQVVLFVVTFGIYGLYWFYQTAKEMKELAYDNEATPGLWTLFSVIPLLNFYAWYRYSELFEKVSSGKLPAWALLILFIICAPAVWVLVQLELNRQSDEILRARAYAV